MPFDISSSKNFSALAAVGELARLAEAPFDLTRPGALSPERIRKMKASACGFDLLYAAERLDEAVLDALQKLADEAGLIDQFLAMKRGAVMNKIEGYA